MPSTAWVDLRQISGVAEKVTSVLWGLCYHEYWTISIENLLNLLNIRNCAEVLNLAYFILFVCPATFSDYLAYTDNYFLMRNYRPPVVQF